MASPRLLTLPRVAKIVGVEYRTLHSWLRRGLLRPSMQESSGIGVPNLFSAEDAVQAKVIVDLRQSGLSFDRLQQAATQLDGHPKALTDGAMVLVNGSVSVVDQDEAAAAIQKESLTLVYNTTHAVQLVHSKLQ
jgi:DNA-binding transcriptional MerR regulator